MYNAIHYIIPIILLCGALWLIRKEYLVYRYVRPKPWILLLRRFVGALAMIAIAVMLYLGDTTLILMNHSDATVLARENRDYATACLNYWFTLMGIVMCTIVLAVWDAIDVLRRLRHIVDASAQEDMQAFCRILEKSKVSQSKAKSGKPDKQTAQEKAAMSNQPAESDKQKATVPPKPAETTSPGNNKKDS